VGDSTARGVKVLGYDSLCARYGVPFIDGQKDAYTKITSAGVSMEVCKTVADGCFLVSLPVLKGHCQTGMTCALKNMKGILSNASKRNFHNLGLHKPIAALNAAYSAGLVIVDSICGDLDFEEGGNPVATNRMFAGTDSVLIDAYGASLLGFDTDDIPYIGMAEKLGAGSADVARARIIEINEPASGAPAAKPTGRARELAAHTAPDKACSACYGNLIHALCRMQENGTLRRLAQKVAVGQGYKGKTSPGVGSGLCCKGFAQNIPGCPPSARDIREFLEG
jgi:hypothetical protein